MAGETAVSVKPLPNGWVKLHVSKLIGEGWLEIGDGYRAKNSEMAQIGLPFVRAGDVNGRVNTIGVDLLGEASLAYVGNKRSQPGDAVITTKGTIGRMAFVRADDPTFIYSPQLCFWRSLNPNKVDPHWLYYALHSQEMRHQMSWSAAQTDMAPYISLSDQRSAFEITLPLIGDQIAIASVLASLDQKIDLNRQMAATLEDITRALFKSWFVDFDPVHAKIEGREGGLPTDIAALFPDSFDDEGLPTGWRLGRAGDYMDILDSQRIPLSARERQLRKGHIPYHGATSVMDFVNTHLFDEVLLLIGEDGSVINSNGNPFLQYTWGKIWVNNHAHVVRGKGVTTEYLKCFFEQVYIAPFITGAVQPKLNQANMNNIPFVIAPEPVRMTFSNLIRPYFARYRWITEEVKVLMQIRNYILPRLLSGEVRVADAKNAIAAA